MATKSEPHTDVVAVDGWKGPPLEVMAPRPQTIADHFTHSVKRAKRGRGNRLYQTKEELTDAIKEYFTSLVNEDGTYNRPPTWTGLGLFLGFSTKAWADKYRDHDEFRDVISQTRMMIDTWREEQAMLPSKGVYPAGIMFLMNREAEQARAYQEMKDVTPTIQDKRPKEAALLIDEVWSKAAAP